MADRSRATKTLLGCGIGCGALALAHIGGCFAFTAWLKSPGELLEPTAMLDPRATTYVACRLDLADTPTREFVDRIFGAAQRPGEELRRRSRSPLVDFLVGWNENRQRRDLTRLFPVTAAWVVWPGEDDVARTGALSLSARGLSHQVTFADWVLGIVSDRVKDWPVHRIAGERVYELPLENGEPVYAFLDSRAVIVCLDLDSAAPAIERLRQRRAALQNPRAPTELERRLAAIPNDMPLRGAVLDRQGEVAQLLAWLAPEAERDAWKQSWEPIEVATVAGRFTGGGGIALTLELGVDPATSGARRELLVDDLRRYFGEYWRDEKVAVRPSEGGVSLELAFEDLPRRLEELQGHVSSARLAEP